MSKCNLYQLVPTDIESAVSQASGGACARLQPLWRTNLQQSRGTMFIANDDEAGDGLLPAPDPAELDGIASAQVVLGSPVVLLQSLVFAHIIEILGITFSFAVCVFANKVSVVMVDDSLFKAIGLLLAVLLSLRAKHAIGRRSKLMVSVVKTMNCAKNLVAMWDVSGSAVKNRVTSMLAFTFQEAACWLTSPSLPTLGANLPTPESASLESLQAADRHVAFILRSKRGRLRAGTSPRALFAHLRIFFDEILEAAAKAKADPVNYVRRWQRNIDREISMLTEQFELLLLYREDLLTHQFRWMMSAVIFTYVAVYPWVVSHESSWVLGFSTFGMSFIFYGLNCLSEELEAPLWQSRQGVNLQLTFDRMFKEIAKEDLIRARCENFLRQKQAQGVNITDELHENFVETLAEDGQVARI